MNEVYLCNDPIIISINNLLSSDECQEIIDDNDGYRYVKNSNKITNLPIDKSSVEKIISLVDELSNKLKIHLVPINNDIKLIYYPIGTGFNIHNDGISYNKTLFNQIRQYQYTMLIYLNNVEVGGETYFPELKLKVKPHIGNCLIYSNCHQNKIDYRSKHGSLTTVSGPKFVLVLHLTDDQNSIVITPPSTTCNTSESEYFLNIGENNNNIPELLIVDYQNVEQKTIRQYVDNSTQTTDNSNKIIVKNIKKKKISKIHLNNQHFKMLNTQYRLNRIELKLDNIYSKLNNHYHSNHSNLNQNYKHEVKKDDNILIPVTNFNIK